MQVCNLGGWNLQETEKGINISDTRNYTNMFKGAEPVMQRWVACGSAQIS